jgi:DNA-cytosine methyltransferase
MNVLSLFDGISCGQQALERANIKVSQYYASEIDKYAIKVTMANYPNTIQLGSVVNVKGADLPKIDMLIGGSPCQSFSFAGKRKGMATKCNQEIITLEQYLELKEQGFEFEGQSYLFWEYVRVFNEVKPKYFLLENVMMEERWEKIISKTLGVHPVEINSYLLSAQNRRRLYWTNIGLKPSGLFGDLESTIKQPKDKGILLKDILEDEVDEKYFLSDTRIETINKSIRSMPYINYETKKYNCLIAGYSKIPTDGQYIVHNLQKRSADRPYIQKNKNAGGTGHLSKSDGKTYCLDTKNSQTVEVKVVDEYNGEFKFKTTNKMHTLISQAGGKTHGKGILITHSLQPHLGDTKNSQAVEVAKQSIRRLTPIECERLQTVKDNYTNHVSDSQRYKMLGNGWTVDVIAYIFGYIE